MEVFRTHTAHHLDDSQLHYQRNEWRKADGAYPSQKRHFPSFVATKPVDMHLLHHELHTGASVNPTGVKHTLQDLLDEIRVGHLPQTLRYNIIM